MQVAVTRGCGCLYRRVGRGRRIHRCASVKVYEYERHRGDCLDGRGSSGRRLYRRRRHVDRDDGSKIKLKEV